MSRNGPYVLRYLEFAASDDGADGGSWEAMASVRLPSLAAVMAEVQALLLDVEQQAPGCRGPEEEGGVWDAHVHQHEEADGWITVTVTITGPWDWGQALVEPWVRQD